MVHFAGAALFRHRIFVVARVRGAYVWLRWLWSSRERAVIRLLAVTAAAVLSVGAGIPAQAVTNPAGQRGSTSGATTLTSAGAPHTAAKSCPDVYLLGARGSGENETRATHDLGPEVNAMATVMQTALAADDITMKTFADFYGADPVTELVPSQYEVGLFVTSPLLGAAYYYSNNVTPYLGSISGGSSAAISEAKFLHSACPDTTLVLAGYSQGAMVMHQAELQLAADGGTGVLQQIGGTLLLGDGDRVPQTAAREFGTSSDGSEGIRTWLRENSHQDVEQPDTTANICNAGDIVCNFSKHTVSSIAAAEKAAGVHQSYVKRNADGTYTPDSALTAAATWVAELVASTRWAAAKAPLPADASASPGVNLNSIACPSVSFCVAVGTYNDSSGNPQGLLLTKSGTAWSAATAPLPAGTGASNAELNAVACSSVSWCVAVGDYGYPDGSGGGLVLTWSGSAWTAAEAPLPPPDPDGQSRGGSLASVACPSSSSCVAVGTYAEYYADQGYSLSRGMLLTWSGTSWTATQPPLPTGSQPGSAAFPYGDEVACPSASSCTVIGEYTDTSLTAQGLLLTWSGGAWTAAEAPTPPGTDLSQYGVQLESVACPSASSCTVVGSYQDSSNQNHGLILAGAGPAWAPTEAADGQFSWSVACPSVSSCTIGGDGVVLIGAGTTWKTINVPPLGAGTYLTSVACPSVSSCAFAAQTGINDALLMMIGTGSTWQAFEVAQPAGTGDGEAYFASVACPSVSTCVAVGGFEGASGGLQGVVATGPS
jgi:hypothetical protein